MGRRRRSLPLAQVPLGIIESVVSTAILWFTVGLNGSYVYLVLAYFNLNMIAKFICILLGHVVLTEQASQVVTPISFVVQMLFAVRAHTPLPRVHAPLSRAHALRRTHYPTRSLAPPLQGFLITLDKIPSAWIWMYYVSLYSQPLRGMLVNGLAGVSAECDEPFATAPDGTKLCAISTGNDILALYGMELGDPSDDSVKWAFYGYSFIYLAVYGIVATMVITHLDLGCATVAASPCIPNACVCSHGSHAEPFHDVGESEDEELLLMAEETGGDEEQGASSPLRASCLMHTAHARNRADRG